MIYFFAFDIEQYVAIDFGARAKYIAHSLRIMSQSGYPMTCVAWNALFAITRAFGSASPMSSDAILRSLLPM